MIDAIRIFLAIAEHGSLSRVARQETIAVSSVSRKLDTLEADLGFKLFNRSSRRLLLTDAGEQFLPRARNILLELEEAKHDLSALSSDPKGLLTVTAPSSFGRMYVAPAVARFLKRYPQMQIDLHIGDEIIDLAARRIDIAIRIGVLPDSDLVATQLAPSKRLVCASPEYIAKHGRPQTPEDLLNHNCLLASHVKPVYGLWCFASLNKGAALPVKGSLISNDTYSLLNAAVEGIGIIHLASWLVRDKILSGELVPLFSDEDLPAKIAPAIHAVRMPGRSHAAKAQLFIAHLKSEFGEPAYWDKDINEFTAKQFATKK
ncbi:LysR substrate-binding domain-containing protein [Cellvibrio sp.]|uniref:LysR family transcriptional regulator n=1 Tax=Cellvibrio sp. TaxID=1965322 RepID=UPI00396489D2